MAINCFEMYRLWWCSFPNQMRVYTVSLLPFLYTGRSKIEIRCKKTKVKDSGTSAEGTVDACKDSHGFAVGLQ